MEIQYTFGFGRIREVLRGKTKKVNSLEELDFRTSNENVIIIPKIIGVY